MQRHAATFHAAAAAGRYEQLDMEPSAEAE
jgi:hypothetical protein